jgi:electron transfer flavoprotein alpha subunit
MSVLVIAEHVRGQLREVTLELITAAQELGEPVTVAVIARDPAALAGDVNRAGVAEIVTVAVDAEEFENDVYQQAVEALIQERQPAVTLLGFTVNSMGFAPAVAAKLGLGLASDVFAFRKEAGELVAERSFYGAKLSAEIEFPQEQVLLLLRPTAWAPTEEAGGAAVSDLPVSISGSRARHLEFVEAPAGDVDITTADFLLSVGRGIGERRTCRSSRSSQPSWARRSRCRARSWTPAG